MPRPNPQQMPPVLALVGLVLGVLLVWLVPAVPEDACRGYRLSGAECIWFVGGPSLSPPLAVTCEETAVDGRMVTAATYFPWAEYLFVLVAALAFALSGRRFVRAMRVDAPAGWLLLALTGIGVLCLCCAAFIWLLGTPALLVASGALVLLLAVSTGEVPRYP